MSENEQVMFWTVFGICIRVVLWTVVVLCTVAAAAQVSGWFYTLVCVVWASIGIAKFWVLASRGP